MGSDSTIDSEAALRVWAQDYAETVVTEQDMDVELPLITWKISNRAKRQAGAVRNHEPPDATVGVPVDWDATDEDSRRVRLTLAWRAYETLGLAEMKGVIRHELIHVEQAQRYGTTNHQSAFTQRAREIDAPTSCPLFTPARYLLKCSGCGETLARRYRRSKTVTQPDNYESRCCGVSLAVDDRTE